MVAITTALSPNPASGSVTADGTEQTLASTTNLGAGKSLVLVVDTASMTDGDVLELRVYGNVNAAADRQVYYASFANAQIDAAKYSIPLPVESGGRFKATLKQTAGANRTYPWKVIEL